MRSTILAAAMAVIAVPIFAQGGGAAPKGQRTVSLTPQQIVAARRVGFRLAAADFQLIRTAGEKGADLKALAGPARTISQWADILPTLFPAGTGPDVVPTRARPEIWSNRADFEQRARTYSEAAARLADAVAADDRSAAGAAWDATWQSCGSCHERYRSDPPPAG